MTGKGLVSAPTKERSDARETLTLDADRPRIRHLLTLDPDRCLCGAVRSNPGGPANWNNRADCVVCQSLWAGLPYGARDAIIEYWRAA